MPAEEPRYASRAERVDAEMAELWELLGDLREQRGLPRIDPVDERKRPTLTLVRGGRDDG